MAKINGTSKADVLYGTVNPDIINGYGGADELRGGGGNDKIWGGANDDFIYGGAGSDSLHGDDGSDYLQGGSGNDFIIGGTGNDGISGNGGDDTIQGGFDGDLIYGGAGNDRFVYNTKEAAPVGDFEQIADFAQGDKLDLSGIDANDSRAGNQTFTFIGNQPFSGAGQVHYYVDTTNHWTVVEGNVDADFMPEFQIILNSNYIITATDIVL
ncbi:MAG: calcium-binding protein [Rickettsiales bacterium]